MPRVTRALIGDPCTRGDCLAAEAGSTAGWRLSIDLENCFILILELLEHFI